MLVMGAGMAVDRAGPGAFDMSVYAALVRYALLQDVPRFSRLFEKKYACLISTPTCRCPARRS